jgi:hypothetical protein
MLKSGNKFEKEGSFEKIDEFLEYAHKILKNSKQCDYSLLRIKGERVYQCGDVADYMFDLLKKEGEDVKYLIIGGDQIIIDRYGTKSTRDIKQIAYPDRIGAWGKHVVCIVNNMVYDPALSDKPIEKEKYFQKMFDRQVQRYKILDHQPTGPIEYDENK